MEWHWWQAYRLRCVSAWCVVVRLHCHPIFWRMTGGGCMPVEFFHWQAFALLDISFSGTD